MTIVMPFTMAVPSSTNFTLQTLQVNGYSVTIRPPVPTEYQVPSAQVERVTVNAMNAYLANGIIIDFRKDGFDRRSDVELSASNPTVDPPTSVVLEVLNSFLAILRYVTRGFMIHRVDSLFGNPWTIRYLNDDGTELAEQEGFIRTRFIHTFSVSQITVHPTIWDEVFANLTLDVPVWDDLRLDAIGAFPNIGTAMVLAYASLETFVAHVLDMLARRSGVSPTLWQWINSRPNRLADPSTEEQFDRLLTELLGHSLKERPSLWTAFQHIRRVRNTFVHEGMARIGAKPLDEVTARSLVVQLDEIVTCIREWLPEELRWPVFNHADIQTEIVHSLSAPSRTRFAKLRHTPSDSTEGAEPQES